MYNRPHTNITESTPDITLTADTIIAAFSSDETKANSRYLDKILNITGTVSELKLEKNKGIITLKTNQDFVQQQNKYTEAQKFDAVL